MTCTWCKLELEGKALPYDVPSYNLLMGDVLCQFHYDMVMINIQTFGKNHAQPGDLDYITEREGADD